MAQCATAQGSATNRIPCESGRLDVRHKLDANWSGSNYNVITYLKVSFVVGSARPSKV